MNIYIYFYVCVCVDLYSTTMIDFCRYIYPIGHVFNCFRCDPLGGTCFVTGRTHGAHRLSHGTPFVRNSVPMHLSSVVRLSVGVACECGWVGGWLPQK